MRAETQHPVWIKGSLDGQHVARVKFSPSDGFISHAVLQSPSFPPIPFYHSLYESPFFNSCLVSHSLTHSATCDLLLIPDSRASLSQIQFAYRISIASAALSVRFVPESGSREKETLFHEYVPLNQKSPWKKGISALPLNQSHRYHILFDVNGGMSQPTNKVAAVTNISLSKECFGIGMSC